MQFQVPQFIEVEDKLVGPLTFKQFLYLLGGGGMCFLIWTVVSPFSQFLALLLLTPFGVFAAALAFYKVNDRPFIVTVESAFKYFFKHRLYIWSQVPKKQTASQEKPVPTQKPALEIPRLTESKLKDLAWSLDINEKTKR